MFEELKNNNDVIYRETPANCIICYQEHLCNILEFMKDFYPVITQEKKKRLDEIFPGICKEIDKNEEMAEQLIFSGILIAERDSVLYAFDLSKAPSRMTSDSIAEPDNVFGSRDGFVENFKENIALIRTRIKDARLNIDTCTIGRRSKTILSLLSLKDVHNDQIKKEILKELKKIDIDAVLSIEDIMVYFQKNHLFPSYHYIGNPDIACRRLYNGEFLLIIDRICCVIAFPTTLAYTSRLKIDGINLPIFSLFERLFVFFSAIISIFACGIICSFSTFQMDSLSLTILSTLKVSQTGIFLPIHLEILLVLLLFELYYIIGFRQSKVTVSSTIVLIGGLIIGENLISSGLAGVFLMTATAICFLLTFIVSSNVTTILAISMTRLFILLCTVFYGFIGVLLGSFLLAYRMYQQRTFGVPYFYPFLPFDVKGIHRFFLSNSSLKVDNRDQVLNVKNVHRRKIHD